MENMLLYVSNISYPNLEVFMIPIKYFLRYRLNLYVLSAGVRSSDAVSTLALFPAARQ